MTITAASARTSHRIRSVMGLLMLLVGAAGTVAPKRLDNTSASTGGGPTPQAAAAQRDHLTQMYAMREAALGAILLSGAGVKSALGATIGLTAVEVITGVRSPALNRRSRITTAVSASLCGVAAAYALSGAEKAR
jgi:hypothetical protein